MNFQITIKKISNKNEYKYLLNNMLKMKEIISVDRTQIGEKMTKKLPVNL